MGAIRNILMIYFNREEELGAYAVRDERLRSFDESLELLIEPINHELKDVTVEFRPGREATVNTLAELMRTLHPNTVGRIDRIGEHQPGNVAAIDSPAFKELLTSRMDRSGTYGILWIDKSQTNYLALEAFVSYSGIQLGKLYLRGTNKEILDSALRAEAVLAKAEHAEPQAKFPLQVREESYGN